MLERDSVASVLSIFAKLVARLEKIIARRSAEVVKQSDVIAEAALKQSEATEEILAAEKAIDKLNKFLED